MKSVLILFVSLFSLPAFASDAIPNGVMDNLRAGVATLTQPIYTFHYAHRLDPTLPPNLDPTSAAAMIYVHNSADHYWSHKQDPAQNADVSQLVSVPQVNGLYVGLDPGSSRLWSGEGDDFLAYRIELPKGLTVLDVSSKGIESRITDETLAYLKKIDCPAATLGQLFWWNLGPSCRNLAVTALKELNIDAIKYTFGAEAICRSQDDIDPSAIILINSEKINDNGIRVFTSDMSKDPDGGKERKLLRAISGAANTYVSGGAIQLNFVQAYFDQVENPDIGKTTKEEVLAYANKHLFNCLGISNAKK